ncbi:MAG: hypothetical protein NVSMB27_02970 [Ktedonobacteraceae bacterium]
MDETKRIEQELINLPHKWMKAWIGKDEATLNRILADDFLITSARSTGELATKSQYLQNALHGWTANTFRYERLQVRLYGETAIIHSLAKQTAMVDGKDWSGQFLLTAVWVKRDGRWQVVTRHSSNPAMATT